VVREAEVAVFHPEGPTLLELARQAFSSTERGYDLLAPKFDRTPFRTPDELLAPLARAVGGERSIDAALDVCCGTGAMMRWLRPLCRTRVVGVDFSAGMLDVARTEVAAAPGSATIELVRADAFELPFDSEFDVVTTVGALGHVQRKDEDRFVGGVARALRVGGRFVFVTAEMPSVASPAWWLARGFNAAMHVRNALLRPPFHMYYLTFLWPDVKPLLERHGFDVATRPLDTRFGSFVIVIATKRRA
jgi:ubiquinone/menaquinone biosynthesis C-methylase UbiE